MHDRVIDIGIVVVEEGKVLEKYNTLIDPESYIPTSIQSLTGISERDLARAPTFNSIAKEIHELLKGAIFVAHNARFDYAFIKQEFERAGIKYSAKCLCTVKLSRRLFPEYKKHDLSTIINRFDLKCSDRHRALPDAEVVADFLKLCGQKFGTEALHEAYKLVMKRNALPVRLSHEQIDALPETAGVYIFYGEDGEVLYVGKSINIKGRVLSHFSDDHRSGKEMRMSQEIADIEAIQTSGELSALLLESHLIKEKQPVYNRLARHSKELVVMRETINAQGYVQVVVERTDFQEVSSESVLAISRSLMQAKKMLNEYAREHNLCPALLGIEKSNRGCFFSQLGICKGACTGKESSVEYNARVRAAFAKRKVKAWPYSGPVMIKEQQTDDTGTLFIVDDWRLISSIAYDEAGKREFLPPSYHFDHDAYKILASHLHKKKGFKPISSHEMRALLSHEEAVFSIDF